MLCVKAMLKNIFSCNFCYSVDCKKEGGERNFHIIDFFSKTAEGN